MNSHSPGSKQWQSLITFLITLILTGCVNKTKLEFYVSVDGNDQAEGSISSPFASIPGAVEAVRGLRESGTNGPVVIYLREGVHRLNRTLVLGMQDGIQAERVILDPEKPGAGPDHSPAHLTIAAYPGETPVISAGVPVTGWKKLDADGKVWVADIPEGLGRFYTLYDEHGRLDRARGNGFAITKAGDKRTLYFPKGCLKDWDNLEDVEIHVRPKNAWVINMLPLESVNEAAGVAKTGVTATYDLGPLPGWVHNPSGYSVIVENVLEVLDEPGEWAVNTLTGKIYLWPSDPAGDGSPKGILAPSVCEMIRVEGIIDYEGPKDEAVSGISFEGLIFTHGDRWPWTTDENRLGWGMQHDWDLSDRPTSMLRFRGAEDCQVIACKFVNSGGTGIRLDLHAQRISIRDCEFAHLGEAGIIMGGYGPGTKDVNHHNEVINNHIHHFSEITWHSPGIWAWQSGSNHMAHNYLHHAGYSPILITGRVVPGKPLDAEGGRTIRRDEIPAEVEENVVRTYDNWLLREKFTHSRYNLLEYNEITHAVKLLTDGNGIYVSGAGTGNIVRYNYLHDNLEHTLPSSIRCDDDQHETLIYGNVLYNNWGFSSCIASKGKNHIINNFIVAPQTVPNWGYLSLEWYPANGSRISRNIIISNRGGGRALSERPRGGDTINMPRLTTTELDSNLYYHPCNEGWMDEHFAMMREVGNEQASLFARPLFVDPAQGDFGFQAASPAIKLGIETLDVSKMGLLK